MNLKQLVAGRTPLRRSRLHDEKGNRVSLTSSLSLPWIAAAYVAYRCAGYRPEIPFLGSSAIRRIRRLITSESRVLEFGSGMSTIWLARRCGFLHSIECDSSWFSHVDSRLRRAGLRNVRYELRPPTDNFDIPQYDDGYFDFALVDGEARSKCVSVAVQKVKPGGYIYLDNSDSDFTVPDGDMRKAEAFLIEAVRRRQGTIEYSTDFPPGLLAATQGMLAKV